MQLLTWIWELPPRSRAMARAWKCMQINKASVVALLIFWHFINLPFFTHTCVLGLICGIKGFMWMKEQLFIAFSINLKTILRSNVDFERQSPCPLAFCGYFFWPMNNEKYIICVMIPEFGWLSDQGQGKKFIKLSFSHKHSVNCQTLHDDTTHSVYLFKIPFYIFCDLEHISRLQQRQTVWGENYCISYKWCLHCSFDFLSILHWLQRAPPAIHHVAHFSFEDICKDAGGKIQLPWYITENCDNY